MNVVLKPIKVTYQGKELIIDIQKELTIDKKKR